MQPNALLSSNAVLYARVSSKEQEREGYSIPAQCKLLRSYARRHDYQIMREFIDVETAKQSGRTHFTEMIHFLEEHPQVRILLCEKTDRLYRNFKDYVTIDELDVTLIFVKEGSVLNRQSRSHDKFIHGIKVLMAKNYIDNLSEETRKGLLEKAEEGEFPACAPLGYRHDTLRKTIEIDPERAPIIRQMFEQYATGKYSIRRLEVQAARQGLTTRRGYRMGRSSVAQILKNLFYIGDFLWSGKRYHGKHPPLIDKGLFDRVQAVIAQRNDTRATVHRFPYTGLLKCANCGCAITAEIKKDRYIYYHCTFDKGNCGGSYVREEELERQFEEILGEFQFSESIFNWMREALRQSQKEKAEFHRRSMEKLNACYAKLQNRIDQIYLDKLDGEIEEAFYRRNVSQWREEQAQIRARIERHEKADQNYIEQGIRLVEVARNASEFYRSQTQAERAALLRFIMPGSALHSERVVPTFTPPFDIIHQIAQEAQACARGQHTREGIKKQAEGSSSACPTLLRQCASARTIGRRLEVLVEARRTVQMEPHRTPRARPPLVAESKPPRVVTVLRKAIEWQVLLDSGQVPNQAAIARREGITRARVTQIMALLRLGPAIRQCILSLAETVPGHATIAERSLRSVAQVVDHEQQGLAFRDLLKRRFEGIWQV